MDMPRHRSGGGGGGGVKNGGCARRCSSDVRLSSAAIQRMVIKWYSARSPLVKWISIQFHTHSRHSRPPVLSFPRRRESGRAIHAPSCECNQ